MNEWFFLINSYANEVYLWVIWFIIWLLIFLFQTKKYRDCIGVGSTTLNFTWYCASPQEICTKCAATMWQNKMRSNFFKVYFFCILRLLEYCDHHPRDMINMTWAEVNSFMKMFIFKLFFHSSISNLCLCTWLCPLWQQPQFNTAGQSSDLCEGLFYK